MAGDRQPPLLHTGSPFGLPTALSPRRVPEAYIRAEVATFPLGRAAFELGLVELDPTLDDRGATGMLWRRCEEGLVEHASGWSLDRIVAVRDRTWFEETSEGPHMQPLHRYLRRLAEDHLRPSRAVTEPPRAIEANEFDPITHFRWLSFSLPEDLLLAASRVTPPARRVCLEPPLLTQRLRDLGVAEIHQHVGAGIDFPLLWTAGLAALAGPELKEDSFRSVGAAFDDGAHLARWLLATALARCVLAEFLASRRGGDSFAGFLARMQRSRAAGQCRGQALFHALDALARSDPGRLPDFVRLHALYKEFHPTAVALIREGPRSLDDLRSRGDPLALRFRLPPHTTGERWLVVRSLAYLDEPRPGDGASHLPAPPADALFARVFWQTVRLRCVAYRHVVQRPLTAGLQWFVRFYDRMSPLTVVLRSVRPEAAWAAAGAGERIAALEIRTGSPSTPFALASSMRELLASWTRVLAGVGGAGHGTTPELGVLLHFIKQRDPGGTWQKGRPPAYWAHTYADPHDRARRRRLRYADFLAGQAVTARAIAGLLRAVPRVLWLVRGIDVARDEIGVPNWVLAPLYRYMRQESAYASAHRRADGAPPLRATVHVGEDFRHLMEGLRRIHEAIQYLLGSGGGRLGHATALGTSPRQWAESVGSLMIPVEERLWDLVLEWRLYNGFLIWPSFRASPPPGRVEQLVTLIRELALHVFGGDRALGADAPSQLAELHHLLHRFLLPPSGELSEAGLGQVDPALHSLRGRARRTESGARRSAPQFPWPRHLSGRVERLLERFLDDEALFRRGQELVDVTVDDWEVEALTAVQDALRRGAAAHGIVVEVNPSSNLLIGDMLDLRNHPILRLSPPEPGPEAPIPVPIAVGSDDPLVFSTSLVREYALLHEAARAAGYPEKTIRDWLEVVRRTGMDARFTLPWRPSAVAMTESLIADLDRYLLRRRSPRSAGEGPRTRSEA